VTAEELKEVIALLDKGVALLNEAITASPSDKSKYGREFDGIMREIDLTRRSRFSKLGRSGIPSQI